MPRVQAVRGSLLDEGAANLAGEEADLRAEQGDEPQLDGLLHVLHRVEVEEGSRV